MMGLHIGNEPGVILRKRCRDDSVDSLSMQPLKIRRNDNISVVHPVGSKAHSASKFAIGNLGIRVNDVLIFSEARINPIFSCEISIRRPGKPRRRKAYLRETSPLSQESLSQVSTQGTRRSCRENKLPWGS